MYSFGETVSIVFWTDSWKPESFYDKIKRNRDMGMHTLCLLGKQTNVLIKILTLGSHQQTTSRAFPMRNNGKYVKLLNLPT